MIYLVLSLYAVILLGFVLTYFFVIYHLAKYSINKKLSAIMLAVFIVISTLLIFSNILLFFAVDWEQLIENLNII
ncbi:MAG: hypothetical protein A2288_03750 [Candidatus Moranbacteria bacterium RIFOXYA12_FULL_44_15]|nr:MAG: hypothetical protein A2288_03750 [Candidatus Moranbacteria bacterium RIFOXYA12_FULL_44_15]OGI35151.1 MAG: hypothetical protein A2259_02165 [Candidatus Moranbacteria bacterium RIFOXYA2_FULL_43_15]